MERLILGERLVYSEHPLELLNEIITKTNAGPGLLLPLSLPTGRTHTAARLPGRLSEPRCVPTACWQQHGARGRGDVRARCQQHRCGKGSVW